ncbi:MAG: SDR family NAD(P)-dependent oxidoreductase [Halobacteriales archaeon]
MRFNDRAAVVTGAARGVGETLARTLAEQGVDVAIADIDVEGGEAVAADIEAEHGVEAVAIETDVTDYESAQRMGEAAVDALDGVDILVNNAGYWTVKPFADTDPDDWEKDVGICFTGTLNCTQALLDHMTEAGYGRILNIVSDAGRIGEPHLAVYSGAKAGVIGFGRALAKEVARFDVTVNNLALGVTDTPGASDFIESFGRENLEKQYPMGRLGEPRDAATGALFFLQDEADYVTGQTISVNGGYATV